jgi:hypothetical protein
MLFILLKTIWILIKAFVTTLLLIAVGPILIITGGFVGWLKNLASNLAVFAAVGPMLAIAFLFLANAMPNGWRDINNDIPEWVALNTGYDNLLDYMEVGIPFYPQAEVLGNSGWIPPFLPFGYDLDIVWLIASFVVMTLIPNVANMIKSAISGKPFGYGTAIGAAIGSAAGVAWAPIGMQVGAAKDAYLKERGGKISDAIRMSRYGQALRQFISR